MARVRGLFLYECEASRGARKRALKRRPAFGTPRCRSEETFELLLEARETAATVHQALVAAGPGGMRRRIDIERERVTLGAVGRLRDVVGAVGHDHLALVVVRVQISGLLHGAVRRALSAAAARNKAEDGSLGMKAGDRSHLADLGG